MKYFLVAIVGCLCLAAVNAGDVRDLEGFFWDNRPILGHFKESPFIDLYKTYAASFVLPLHPERPLDDFRNYLPSGDECMNFFSRFRIDKYKLRDIDDFIVMDACLGYLYESEFHEKDKEYSAHVEENLNTWLNDEQLKKIYEGTQIDDLNEEGKICIGNLMLHSVLAKKQFQHIDCDKTWLKVFLDFAKCHKTIPEDSRKTDTYIETIYDLVKIRGRRCFFNEIGVLNKGIRESYANNLFFRAKTATSRSSNLAQANQRMWPKPIVELLTAVQNPQQTISLRQVARITRGVGLGVQDFKNKLLFNMAKYATERVVKGKFGEKELKAFPDPTGSSRYRQLIDTLCNYFRPKDNPGFYDYTTPFVRMVKMLEYPEIFDISKQVFVREVLNQSFESGVLYLSVSSCNLLTYTEGQFVQKVHNGKDKYVVEFVPDTSEMVIWPDTGFW